MNSVTDGCKNLEQLSYLYLIPVHYPHSTGSFHRDLTGRGGGIRIVFYLSIKILISTLETKNSFVVYIDSFRLFMLLVHNIIIIF